MPVISFAPDTGVWLLSTPRTSYALRIDETGSALPPRVGTRG